MIKLKTDSVVQWRKLGRPKAGSEAAFRMNLVLSNLPPVRVPAKVVVP